MRLLLEIIAVAIAGGIGWWVGRGERETDYAALPPLPRWPTVSDLHREGNREWNTAVEMAARQVEIWPHGRQSIRNAIAAHIRTYTRGGPTPVEVPPPSDSETLAC